MLIAGQVGHLAVCIANLLTGLQASGIIRAFDRVGHI